MITVKRAGAMGDVIFTSPIVRKLHQQTSRIINVITSYPHVFDGCDYVKTNISEISLPFVNLDLAYERRPNMHVIDAYAEEAGIRLSDDEKHITLWYNNNMPLRNKIDLFLKEYSQKSFVVIHPTVSWPNRTLGTKWWDELVTILFKNNILPVIVGTYVDAITPSNNILDLRNQLSIQEIAYLIDQSKVFIGFDSGILNVAGTTSTHIIGIFTHVKAEFRMPYRNGILGSNYTVIKTPLDCYGCHHLQPPPVTGFSCERNDVACIKTIDVNAVVDAALKYF